MSTWKDWLNQCIEDAEMGRSVFITRIRNLFDNLNGDSGSVRIALHLELAGGIGSRSFSLLIPAPRALDVSEADMVREYLCATVYNILSTFGGRSLTFLRSSAIPGLDDFLGELIAEFQPESSKADRQGYGRCLNVAERMADAIDCRKPGSARFTFRLAEIEQAPEHSRTPLKTIQHDEDEPLVHKLRVLPRKLKGKTVLGMDIGGSDIKLVLSIDGRIISYKEYDWFPAQFVRSRQLIEPILLMVRWARVRAAAEGIPEGANWKVALDGLSGAEIPDHEIEEAVSRAEKALVSGLRGFDGIGLCFPDVVVRDKIVGGEVYKTRGIRSNPDIDYEKDFAQLTGLNTQLEKYCKTGGRVRNINDGPMAAFTAAVESAFSGDKGVNDGVFAHTLGTELGTGWLDEKGNLPEIPLEVYNYIIDLGCRPERRFPSDDPRSLSNFNTAIAGTLQKYTSQSGVFRLAIKHFSAQRPDLLRELYNKEFLKNEIDGSIHIRREPRDMRKALLEHLMSLPEREGEGICRDIFREIGEYLAIMWQETRFILNPRVGKRVLFGRLVKNPVCFRLMAEGAARIAPEMELTAADEESAWTPMMRQLRDEGEYTVAQFAQAIGAAHFAVAP